MVSDLALFCLATYLATFKKLGDFFQIIWSTWSRLCRVFCCDGAVNVAHVNGPFEWPGNVDKWWKKKKTRFWSETESCVKTTKFNQADKNLDKIFKFRWCRSGTPRHSCPRAKQPSLKLNTWPQKLLGLFLRALSLPIRINSIFSANFKSGSYTRLLGINIQMRHSAQQ